MNKSVSLKKLGLEKNVIAVDCWSKDVIGNIENNLIINKIPANSVKVMLLKNRPDTPSFLFLDANIYMGADKVWESYSNSHKELIVKINRAQLNKYDYPQSMQS